MASEDVCWSKRNVKFINESFYNMRCPVMFITAVCLNFEIFPPLESGIRFLKITNNAEIFSFCFS